MLRNSRLLRALVTKCKMKLTSSTSEAVVFMRSCAASCYAYWRQCIAGHLEAAADEEEEEEDEEEEDGIPGDVPRGHMVVYVGEESSKMMRFVIKVSFLHHPLFRALLRRAQEEYEFMNPPGHAKLCIPCDEALFLNVLRRIADDYAAAPSSSQLVICPSCFSTHANP